jgi:polyisoprenoid-binding protein YceI
VARYQVDPAGTRVISHARSSIHDTHTVWNEVSGVVLADADSIGDATAELSVNMAALDAGDFLKNRKLKKDLDVARHPRATFRLTGLEDVSRKDDGSFEATARGVLSWRGKDVNVTAAGTGSLSDASLDATARFELDVTDLGIAPPRFLMFKVEKVVSVEVTLRATTAP